MEATLGLTENYSFGHGPEPLPHALARKQQLMLWLQTQSIYFTHTHVCNLHQKLPSHNTSRFCRQIRASSIALSASLITLPAESTFKFVAENAYNSPSIEPHMVSISESTPLRSHPNTRKHFPANGASVCNGDSNALFEENPFSAVVNDEDVVGPPETVVMWFKCLELTGVNLRKCLKNAASVSEDDVVLLLKTFGSYGFSRSEIKSMFAKYPPLVKVKSLQVFTLNTEDKLKRGVEFFRSMGLEKEKDLKYLFARSAQLFCCSIEKNLQPTINFFRDRGLEDDLSAMIVTFPSMLGQNVEVSLAPKYEYLVGEMKRTHKELVEFPQYFGYSLERRIKPRHRLLSERGLHKSLPSMLACKDGDFLKRYVEPYSPLPQHIAAIHEGASMEPVVSTKQPVKQKIKRKKVVAPQTEILAKPIQQDQSFVASTQERCLIVEDVFSAKDQTDVTKEEWEFLNFTPQLQQSQLYPASFRKIYKNLTPCGMWIHAYKFDTE